MSVQDSLHAYIFVLWYACHTWYPASPVLGILLKLWLELCIHELEVVNRADTEDAHARKSSA